MKHRRSSWNHEVAAIGTGIYDIAVSFIEIASRLHIFVHCQMHMQGVCFLLISTVVQTAQPPVPNAESKWKERLKGNERKEKPGRKETLTHDGLGADEIQ